MAGGKIIYLNEEAMELQLPDGGLETLLRGNYIYASINCAGNRPLHLSRHLHYLSSSYETIYSHKPELRFEPILEAVQRLLYLNGASLSGNVVTLYLLPPEDFVFGEKLAPQLLMAYECTVMYGSGYTLGSLRPRATVVNYDIPFEAHRTAVSLTAARYMDAFAARRDANIAIRSSRSGRVVSSGDYPLFAVRDASIWVTPLDKGAGGSVERELMLKACDMCGLDVEERETMFEDLTELDELIVFKNTGLVSPLCVGNHYFTNLAALRLERVMAELTADGM